MPFSTGIATQVVLETMADSGQPIEIAEAPIPMAFLVDVFQRIRSCFRYMRYGNIYSQEQNFLELFSGHILNITFGENRYLKVAAQCVLITSLILECIERQKKVYRCYDKLICQLKNEYPYEIELPAVSALVEPNCSRFLSPSCQMRLKSDLCRLKIYLSKLAYRIYRLAVEIFKLCLTIADTVDSFSLSTATTNTVSHVFVNLSQQLNILTNNGEELLQKIEQNSELIDKMFYVLGSPFASSQLIYGLRPIVQSMREIRACADTVRTASNGLFWHIIQEGIFGFMAVINLTDWLPDSLIPPLVLPQQSSVCMGKLYGRYPSLHLLRWRPAEMAVVKIPSARRITTIYQELQT